MSDLTTVDDLCVICNNFDWLAYFAFVVLTIED